MTKNETPDGSFEAEFHNLGKNFLEALRAAWDHPERKRMEAEILSGLSELSSTIKNEADSFTESPTGQRLKSDVQDFGERIRDPEIYNKARSNLLGILITANAELEKVIDQISTQREENVNSTSNESEVETE